MKKLIGFLFPFFLAATGFCISNDSGGGGGGVTSASVSTTTLVFTNTPVAGDLVTVAATGGGFTASTPLTNVVQTTLANIFTTTQTQSGTGALWVSTGTGADFQASDLTVKMNLQALASSSVGIVGTSTNHGVGFITNSSIRMTLSSGGALGINNQSPNATGLDVSSKTVIINGSGASISLGGGAALTAATSGSGAMDFGATAAGTCDSLTLTVAGAVDGDAVMCGIPNALATADTYQSFYYFVNTTNTVTVKRCNLTNITTALSNPASATVKCVVWR